MTKSSIFAILVVVCMSVTAEASPPWGMVASSCSPGDPAIQNNRYTVSGGAVGNNGSNTELITLYCPISNPYLFLPDNWLVGLTYTDTTGLNDSMTFVKAALIKMDRATGNITQLGEVTSESSGGSQHSFTSPNIAHTFDFDSYYYYVRIDIDRCPTCTAKTTTAYAVLMIANFP